MFGFRKLRVGDQQGAILSRRGRFVRVLGPGEHTVFGLGHAVEWHDVGKSELTTSWQNVLLHEHPKVVERHFTLADIPDDRIGIVRRDGKIAGVLGPGARKLYWRRFGNLTVDLIDFHADRRIPKEMQSGLAQLGPGVPWRIATVSDYETGLLIVDGEVTATLGPGVHCLWNPLGEVTVAVTDTRIQQLEVAGQEILTSDKAGIRVNLTAHYRVADARKLRAAVKNFEDYLYKQLQFALRRVLSSKTLDEVLAQRGEFDREIQTSFHEGFGDVGVEVSEIGVKDIILPGEIREIMNRVLDAEKAAQANLIQRREETAATRSLLNTARLMQDNPILIRLKELETLEKISGKIGSINVQSGLGDVLDGLLKGGKG